MTLIKRVVAVVVAAFGLGSAGCATVQPWQRGQLANPAMQFDPDPDLAAFESHWLEAREGAEGGSGQQGGGCGCK